MSEQTNAQPAAPQPGVAPPPARKKRRRLILSVIAVVILAVIGVAGWFMSRDDPDNAKVGSCITGNSISTLRVVDCADSAAEYKVVKRLESKTRSDFQKSSEQMCESAPSTTNAMWIGETVMGFVLCLEPAR